MSIRGAIVIGNIARWLPRYYVLRYKRASASVARGGYALCARRAQNDYSSSRRYMSGAKKDVGCEQTERAYAIHAERYAPALPRRTPRTRCRVHAVGMPPCRVLLSWCKRARGCLIAAMPSGGERGDTRCRHRDARSSLHTTLLSRRMSVAARVCRAAPCYRRYDMRRKRRARVALRTRYRCAPLKMFALL